MTSSLFQVKSKKGKVKSYDSRQDAKNAKKLFSLSLGALSASLDFAF
jgi:hypothetical protein